MPFLRRPSADDLDAVLAHAETRPLSAPDDVLDHPPARGWFRDSEEAIVGVGADAFRVAADAVHTWQHVDLGWFVVHRAADTPVEPGRTVVCAARVLGLWWVSACRVVSVIDEADADGARRSGFSYATVKGHPERGEERFLVTMTGPRREVHAHVTAVSRPGRWFTWVGLPVARAAQRRFRLQVLARVAALCREHRAG